MTGQIQFPALDDSRRKIADLTSDRAQLLEQARTMLDTAQHERRDLTVDEQRQHGDLLTRIQDKTTELATEQTRHDDLGNVLNLARSSHGGLESGVGYGDQLVHHNDRRGASLSVTRNETVYRRSDPGVSWVRDMVAAGMYGDQNAADRLRRNNREVASTLTRALSATDGGGGEFVPPAWMVADYVRLARAGRVVANRVRNQPLPPGTDTINLPRLATGTATAEQATQNSPVQNTDATTDSVTASVATLAGQQVISLQLIEQSPINIDEELLGDLLADLAIKVDNFVINNNAVNKRGLLNVTGINAITYTDATPTVGELYPKLADAIQQIHTTRFMAADHVFMHPRRWGWIMAAVDTQQRPLAVPAAQSPQNVIAAVGTIAAEGFVGSMHGLPVFVDPNIPTNLGAGTNEDRIIVAKADDTILYESLPRAEAFREPLAAQMSVLLRVYEYCALHSARYPKSISVISGTGLITPTF